MCHHTSGTMWYVASIPKRSTLEIKTKEFIWVLWYHCPSHRQALRVSVKCISSCARIHARRAWIANLLRCCSPLKIARKFFYLHPTNKWTYSKSRNPVRSVLIDAERVDENLFLSYWYLSVSRNILNYWRRFLQYTPLFYLYLTKIQQISLLQKLSNLLGVAVTYDN